MMMSTDSETEMLTLSGEEDDEGEAADQQPEGALQSTVKWRNLEMEKLVDETLDALLAGSSESESEAALAYGVI